MRAPRAAALLRAEAETTQGIPVEGAIDLRRRTGWGSLATGRPSPARAATTWFDVPARQSMHPTRGSGSFAYRGSQVVPKKSKNILVAVNQLRIPIFLPNL